METLPEGMRFTFTDGLTAAVVALTGIYAWVTYRILCANRDAVRVMGDQVRAATRPYVTFELVSESPFILARVRNAGTSCAHGIQIETEPIVYQVSRKHASPAVLPSKGLAFLAPGQEMTEYLGYFDEISESAGPLRFKGKIRYLDGAGSEYTEGFQIDLEALSGMLELARPNLARELERIARAAESLVRTIEVIAENQSDRKRTDSTPIAPT